MGAMGVSEAALDRWSARGALSLLDGAAAAAMLCAR